MRVPVAVVDALEGIDVEQGHGERLLVASSGSNGPRELILEGSLVGQVRQRVAHGAPQDHAMVTHQASAADQIEEATTTEQREQTNEGEDPPYFTALHVIDVVVVGRLIGVAAARKVDRDNELEVTRALLTIVLTSQIGRAS